jgi:N-acetylneuraminate synthase
LSEREEGELKEFTEGLGMIFLSTPFSRKAANRLEHLGVKAFKIGSGECNNYPLVKHIASFGKPVILSTGMNDFSSIWKSVMILETAGVPYALLHCTSIYPTPYDKIHLGALQEIKQRFPFAVVGLSDHSFGNYACFAAIPLGASILEKHFTLSRKQSGADMKFSIEPSELSDLIFGCRTIHQALGGHKTVLDEEQDTIDFAYACVVSIKDIKKGEVFTEDNIWVKRPGTGQIHAEELSSVMGKKAMEDIKKDIQIQWKMVG